eukprot:TRINITY_DN33281_c0_g1_i1.p1 TRINITY_DN33281_c0_g1~~TRINITY_DN33281_c0_g1_i1.p1  ORF type:complete len:368 (+),score=66.46 TRINITY_DN33281_c0_g1_i1:116-1219(+)
MESGGGGSLGQENVAALAHNRQLIQDASSKPWGLSEVVNLLLGRACCCSENNAQAYPAGPLGSSPREQAPSTVFCQSNVLGLDVIKPDRDSQWEQEKVDRDLIRGSLAVDGTNPLRLQLLGAVRNDDAPAVLQHVADGADIPLMSEALRYAAHRGSAAVVRELVAVGLCVNDCCPQTGFAPLQLASASGHHIVCEVLLDALADVHKPINGTTPLTMARRSGHAEVEEVITRHITSLVMSDQGDPTEAQGANRRAHVLPRVSPFLSEAVLQAMPSKLSSDHGREATGPLDEASKARGLHSAGGPGGGATAPVAIASAHDEKPPTADIMREGTGNESFAPPADGSASATPHPDMASHDGSPEASGGENL